MMFTFLKPFVQIRGDAVFPLLPAVDLIDSSLIQHVLLRQNLWEARESAVSVQQLFQALQELFQRVRVEKPGQVHPRASELTLSLLTTMYDRWGWGDHAVTLQGVFSCLWSLTSWGCLIFVQGLISKKASLFVCLPQMYYSGGEQRSTCLSTSLIWMIHGQQKGGKSTFSYGLISTLEKHAHFLLGQLCIYVYI